MESSRRLVILLVAGVIVAFVAIAIRNRVSTQEEAVAPLMIAVARHDISLGTLIQPGSDIDWVVPAEGMNTEGIILSTTAPIDSYNGAVVRRPLKAGDPIPQSGLMRSNEGGFMSAVLEPGMRAVSVAVNATSGNAGFISPGDRVDLIVTHRIKRPSGTEGSQESVVSETFVRDVRVLAVDQMLDNPENKAILAKTVTVEVNDQQAEQIAVATEMGKISMSLRSISSAPSNPQENIESIYGRTTSDADVSNMIGGTFAPRMKVIRGDQVENLEFAK
jgi:pilus assembly protein CpaB